MASKSTYTYTPLTTTAPPRPLADIPYESDDEVDLKRRAIPLQHPPTDLHRTPAIPRAPSPPAGVALSSVVLVCVGLWMMGVGMGMGWGWGWMRGMWLIGRWAFAGVGGFLLVSGAYTLYQWTFSNVTRYEGGYLFPSYYK